MRWKTGLGNRLLVANLPTNMLCGLVLLAGEFGVNAESWFAGMRLNVQEIHDPQARVSYRQASEIIRRALPTLPIDGVGLAMGEKQNGGNFGLLGLAMKTAPTFGDAVQIGLELSLIHFSEPTRLGIISYAVFCLKKKKKKKNNVKKSL